MSFEVKIPAVGESITSGMIGQWHKKNGEAVSRGDILVTIETDKVSTELEAEESGVLEVKAAEGEEVAVGTVIALISSEGGSPEIAISEAPAAPAEETPAPEPAAPEQAAQPPSPAAAEEAEESAVRSPQSAEGRQEEAAEAPGLKLVESIAAESKPEIVSTPAADEGRVTRRRMSPLRKKVATHLVSAQQTAAILTTFNECDMTAVMRLRKQLQEDFVERHGIKLGFMSFFVKAAVSALKHVPGVNARIDGNDIVTNHFYDIGVAVSTERGLIVPVIRDCDRKSFAQIEQDIVDIAEKAREGKITIDDLQGGVFTISNGGIYGSLLSTPILNPPQAGILGMHTIQERPIAIDGEVVVRPMMYLALSYDHRLVDGKEAVTFLIRIKDCIEQPERLLVEA